MYEKYDINSSNHLRTVLSIGNGLISFFSYLTVDFIYLLPPFYLPHSTTVVAHPVQ